ncbi:MAG: xylulokinase [Verrucomicrobiales bacterium]|nr:xylulokinase [Verrucomicrobiales bacterium]
MYFIGIDSGTQSTKSVVLDLESGKLVAEAAKSYDLIDGLPPGHLEQHPRDWANAVDETIASCLEQLGEKRKEVRGIGVSGQQHGLVILDAHDNVIRPAKLWCDTSTTEQCEQFSAEFGGISGLIEKAGNAIMAGYTIPKLLWIKQNEQENFESIASVLLPHDYINFHLTGVKRMEYGDASGTGILNIRTREWDTDLIDFVDPRLGDALPELGSSRDIHGTLRADLAEKWGLKNDVIISAGGGDNMMGAIGTGNISPGVITASFGTSGTLYGCADQPVIDPRGEIAAFCDSTDRWMPLACTMNVTVITELVRGWFGWDHAELEKQIRSVPAGADGLHFLPYLNGERTPNLPDGNAVIQGMKGSNATTAHIARAAMEGATLGLAYGLQRFAALGLKPSEIRLTGGGSKSAVWREISADVFGVPVVGLVTAEGASLGGAIQAAFAAGQGDYAELCGRLVEVDESTRCEPDNTNSNLYIDKLSEHTALTGDLKDAGRL